MEDKQNYKINNENEEERDEFPEELSSIKVEAFANPEDKNFKWGVSEGSYLAGFAAAINSLGLTEATIGAVIVNKMELEYRKEMLRMQLESEERIARIYSKIPLQVGFNGG